VLKRNQVFSIVAAVTLVSASAGFSAESVRLTTDTDLRVVLRGDFGNAGDVLRELLTGYLLRLLDKDELSGPRSTVVFTLEAKAECWRDIPRSRLADVTDIDAFEIEIAGPDAVRISGTTALSAGFGVMHFLERHMGIMWLFPGELGLHMPTSGEFTLPAGEEQVKPAFMSRLATGFVYRDKSIPTRERVYDGLLQEHRHFFYGHDYFKSLKLRPLASPSHNMIHVIPPELKATHPNVFPVQDGRRWFPPPKSPDSGAWQCWHPCYSQKETIEIAIEKAHTAFQQGRACFSLGINDGHRVQCECERCLDAGWPDTYYRFVSRVAEAVKDTYPPHLIGVIAYGDVAYPPKGLKLPENVIVICASGGPERHLRWSEHAHHLGTYEWAHGQGYWIPNLPLAAIESNARFYQRHNVKSYRSELYPIWAFDGPKVYLRLKQLWFPDLDLDAALARYCDAAYGEGGDEIYAFFQHWADKRDVDVLDNGATPMHAGQWPYKFWRNPEEQMHWCTQADFDFCEARIRTAERLVRDKHAKRRLAMLRTFFDESVVLYQMRQLARRAFDTAAQRDPARAVAEVIELRGRRRKLLQSMHQHPEWFLGTSAGVDENLRPTWEDRGSMFFDRQLESALLTSLLELDAGNTPASAKTLGLPEEYDKYLKPVEVEPLQATARERHGWYAKPGFTRLEATSGKSIAFRTGKTDQRIADHPLRAGRRSVHWLAGMAKRGVPITDTALCRVEFNATGRAGKLGVRLHWGSNNRGRTEVQLREDFLDGKEAIQRTFVFRPIYLDRKTLREDPNPPPDAQGSVNVFVTWDPLTDDSPLEGTLTISRIDVTSGQRRSLASPW